MAPDPVHQAQLQLSRARNVRHGRSEQGTRLDGLDGAGRERFFKTGSDQVANLAARIEAQTGFRLESSRVLDFGCGVGRTALPLAERCGHVYGLDVSPAVLREADRYAQSMSLSNVEWLMADELDNVLGRYDLVVSFWVFQHIPSREGERIFTKLVEGLIPGGAGAIHFTLKPSFRGLDLSYPYQLMNSYSLNRIGRLLAEQGITEWHAKWHARPASRSYDNVTLIFRKPEARSEDEGGEDGEI